MSLSGQGAEDPEVAGITAVCTAELASLPGSDVMPGHPDHQHHHDEFYHASRGQFLLRVTTGRQNIAAEMKEDTLIPDFPEVLILKTDHVCPVW